MLLTQKGCYLHRESCYLQRKDVTYTDKMLPTSYTENMLLTQKMTGYYDVLPRVLKYLYEMLESVKL